MSVSPIPASDIGEFINLPAYAWTDIPAAAVRVYAGSPTGGLAQVLPDGTLRLLGAYEIRVEKMPVGNPDVSLL